MSLKHFVQVSLAFAFITALSGCAGSDFAAYQVKSLQKVGELRDNFNLAGFTPQDVVEGHYDFETGGTPNARFLATAESGMTYEKACIAVNRYANSLTDAELNYFPRGAIASDHVVVECIAALKDLYSTDFRLNGKLKSGEPFSVSLSKSESLSISVMTSFLDYEYDSASGEALMPGDPTLAKYLDGFATYRAQQGFDLYTEKELEAAKLVSKSKDVQITPIADKDGFIRRIHVKYADNFTYDQCYSAMPWSKQEWGVSDPGPRYPVFTVEKNEDLTSFGSQTLDSDCRTMPLHPIDN